MTNDVDASTVNSASRFSSNLLVFYSQCFHPAHRRVERLEIDKLFGLWFGRLNA